MDAWHDLIRPYVTGAEGESYPYTLLFNPAEFDANLDQSVPPFGPQSVVGLREFLPTAASTSSRSSPDVGHRDARRCRGVKRQPRVPEAYPQLCYSSASDVWST